MITDFQRLQTVLKDAQSGNVQAREEIGAWMVETAQMHANSSLRFKKSSLSGSSLTSHVLLKLVRGNTIENAPDIPYLIAAITRASRELLIDHYRRVESRRKHTQVAAPSGLPWFEQVLEEQGVDQKELDEALALLQELDPRKASVINLRFFCEMSTIQVAEALGISKSTVESDLRLARAWLYGKLRGGD